MSLPSDYLERVYAGVLGKVIGVYLGRPFEGWTYDKIMERLGEITYYVHERRNVPLIVTDDDISGTFTFLRALPDYGNRPDLTPAQIGQTWLNYIIERRTILWWGGLGNSTEHTAYLRLKHGLAAPASGSIATNGKVVAEQIGAQIFIDGWAMVAPGDPALAADLARRAGSVSHDGEAIYGAQVLAAMEAQAFVERDLDKLIDCAVGFIPKDSIIYRMIGDIRTWHAKEPDWRKTREQIAAHYGYDKYGGNCHMVPNHALIIHALLHGNDDFQRSLMIVNTCGWDTDCNSGNVGCLLGIKNGLAGLETGPDWRGPVADRMYLPTADGGRAITDAVTETIHVVNVGRALAGEAPIQFKDGARFHFELPGSLQGFEVEPSVESSGTATLENVAGQSMAGERSLAIRYHGLALGRCTRVRTPTFIPSKEIATYFEKRGYPLLASPSLHPGQTVRAALWADAENAQPVTCTLQVHVYSGPEDELKVVDGPQVQLAPGVYQELTWQIEDLQGQPIAFVGLQLSSDRRADGVVYLDYLRWDGEPQRGLQPPARQRRDVAHRLGQRRRPVRTLVAGVLPAGAKRRPRAVDPGLSRVAQLHGVSLHQPAPGAGSRYCGARAGDASLLRAAADERWRGTARAGLRRRNRAGAGGLRVALRYHPRLLAAGGRRPVAGQHRWPTALRHRRCRFAAGRRRRRAGLRRRSDQLRGRHGRAVTGAQACQTRSGCIAAGSAFY